MRSGIVLSSEEVRNIIIDNNVWRPDEYPAGWKEVTETITIL